MTPERIAELRRYLAGYQHIPFGGPGELSALLDIAERFASITAILKPLRALEAAAWTNRTIEAAARNALPALLREIQETP